MRTLIRTAVTATALVAVTAACTASPGGTAPPPKAGLGAVRLVAYDSCEELLSGLREHTARNVTPYGLGSSNPMMAMEDSRAAVLPNQRTATTPEHSTTNVHEAGVDEPDLVKTDGDRVITVTDGTLRIIDTATRKITATLELAKANTGVVAPSDLLVAGDRALVLLHDGGMMAARTFAPSGDTRYVLVDLAAEPRILSSVRAEGTYLDARMVGSTVRLVIRNQPEIMFPQWQEGFVDTEQLKVNRAAVLRAPIESWLPEFEITDASGAVTKHTVDCERVSHPADYTGTSLLTVHTIDLARGLTAAGTDPISLAADGDIVYGTGTSLYVASNPRWWLPIILRQPIEDTPATSDAPPAADPTPTDPSVTATATPLDTATPSPEPSIPPEETEVHRFDIAAPGPPAYVASGKVPGRLLNQYSLSEYEGHLRVATTLNSPDGRSSSSTVHVLRADTLAKTGEVSGLGEGERIYSVRFIGAVGYCVTFRQVDPLYTLDLRDPAAPRVTGELKITGYSAYLHPGASGRLIGIGQEASEQGRTLGTQVSLFDVSDPAAPRRLSQFFQKESGSEAEWDPHAFLYWPKTGLAVIPLTQASESGALVLRIDDSGVSRLGMIRHPAQRQEGDPYQPGIQRSLVIGDELWTVSHGGIQVNDATTLAERAWIPNR
ncbi:beta-propeller domain-containing protein [Nonomuraea jiangxiensis]|uniref:Secreted protein containing C-terminal beta-propeller domain n=1 Tax=Nonomuraea jiangxiensis TaxID=633440 RepID=A0A1G8G232_9ACTN|nr:beta-propeller domain-containing protein [Nonomuraea jiangxiensis]SDH88468.1 Secreted protein containing C-terminal beta-propeller domain [Nonomuraea jiangxiensis]